MHGNISTLNGRRPRRHAFVIASAIITGTIAAGCAGRAAKQSPTPPVPLPSPVTQPASDGVVQVTPESLTPRVSASQEERDALDALQRQGMVIHFDYDSSQIRAADLPLIAAHARFANRFGQIPVRLEGHADERGSREYNIGLGERRAQAVKQALELQGVPSSRISTVSYGEERPVADGSGEQAWSRNRRVEIRYLP